MRLATLLIFLVGCRAEEVQLPDMLCARADCYNRSHENTSVHPRQRWNNVAKQKPTNELQWKYTKDQNRATGKSSEWRIYSRVSGAEYLYHVYLNDVLQLHASSRYLPEAKRRVLWIEDGRWERWEDIISREGDTEETKAKYLKVQKLPEPEVETVQDDIESLIGNLEVDQVAATERRKGSSGQRSTGLIGLLRRMFGWF
jgi:hypothetical protein